MHVSLDLPANMGQPAINALRAILYGMNIDDFILSIDEEARTYNPDLVTLVPDSQTGINQAVVTARNLLEFEQSHRGNWPHHRTTKLWRMLDSHKEQEPFRHYVVTGEDGLLFGLNPAVVAVFADNISHQAGWVSRAIGPSTLVFLRDFAAELYQDPTRT